MYTHASCDPVYIYFCPVLTDKFNKRNSIRKELYQCLHKNKRIKKTFNEKRKRKINVNYKGNNARRILQCIKLTWILVKSSNGWVYAKHDDLCMSWEIDHTGAWYLNQLLDNPSIYNPSYTIVFSFLSSCCKHEEFTTIVTFSASFRGNIK